MKERWAVCALSPWPPGGMEGAGAVTCYTDSYVLPDPVGLIRCFNFLKIMCKTASFNKPDPLWNTALTYFLWLAISYFYFLVLYNVLCKHLPKEMLSSLRAETIPISFLLSISFLMRNNYMVRAQGEHKRHRAQADHGWEMLPLNPKLCICWHRFVCKPGRASD